MFHLRLFRYRRLSLPDVRDDSVWESMVSSTICLVYLTPKLLLSRMNRVCRIHSEDLLDPFCHQLSRLSLRNQHQILENITMRGRLKAANWKRATVYGIHADVSSIMDEQPNKFSSATRRRMSAIDDERTMLAKLLHKLLSVESSTCSAFDLLSVVETMDLASRLELQSNSSIVDSDGQTASSDSSLLLQPTLGQRSSRNCGERIIASIKQDQNMQDRAYSFSRWRST
jgi:hypothetical protein